MAEPKKKIDHMVFNVRNLDEAVKFYTEVVGMRVVMKFEDRKMAFLSFGGDEWGPIRLFETGGTNEPDRQHNGFNHMAFQPEGGDAALDQLHQRLIDKNAKIDIVEHGSGRHRSVYFFDPDGNRLEFYSENPEWTAQCKAKVAAAFADDK
jgi:lactoylglutathione lyase